ncbi:flagellar hook-associated protein FlgL [Oceanobacillus halophilus]|uniref:Flagellar hook-associated protein FlgL n=1 Tax=Oceanobacillus halophilus TaxID=930130 RepID=A0A495A6W8_9BACI|nr:flagellar hook-associated protein FlgL [Oceanobacillus halophilus]RKQ35577.1 flagellar hook-associated protein FlgL [Oceanobacillus halophilus]
MRVTQGMLSQNMLRNLSSSYEKMDKYMNQLNTGKKITKPSDDPVIAMKGMGYRSEVLQVEQYQRNVNEVHNWYDNSDAALDKATQTLQRIRELAIQANNGTYDNNERVSISQEVEQLKEHLIDIANTKVNDKYIFNGTDTKNKLVDENENISDTPYQSVQMEVAKGTNIKASVDGSKVFDGLFSNIDSLIGRLNADENTKGNMDTSIEELDQNLDLIINERADLGARMNRLELVENRLKEQEIIATQTMSNNEDIDYSKVITELISQESVHRAALSSGSRIIQPTLLDFLR